MDVFEHKHEFLENHTSIISMCNVLSEQGWELVCIIYGGYCVFRRPRRRNYYCIVSKKGENPIYIWADGNLDLLVRIQVWLARREKSFRFVACPPDKGNGFKWEAFIYLDISHTKKGHLVDEIKSKFLTEQSP